MCRHVAWLGAPRTLASLVLEPAHGLLVQSYAPRRQAHGRVNADGWGIGWWADGPEPARWRANRPIWTDASLASVAPHIRSSCIVAAVRSATVGMPLDETACAPFTDGRRLLSHNGIVSRDVLGPQPAAESMCDSAQLAAAVLTEPPALGAHVQRIGAADPTARLNVLLADGDRILATAWGDTLSVLATDDGVAVASEPYDDDPRWADVPDRSLVEVTRDGIRISSLEGPL
ncbi:MAG TPA: ergothioneine biosynthesis protein EgtC [Mycobacteriales bacterium]|nr:ergothioneine biosynthesis protein EgtC [Mycobacteriales bacterium]